MHSNERHSALGLVPWVLEATVVTVSDGRDVEIELASGERRRAVAPVSTGPLAPRDRVVVLGNGDLDGGGAFVVAILESSASLRVRDGTHAVVDRRADGSELLRVTNAAGSVLFEYDPSTGCSTALAPAGTLSVRAAQGRLQLHGEHGVDLTSGADVRVQARGALSLERASDDGAASQRVWLDRRGVGVAASAIFALSERLESRIADAKLTFGTVRSTARALRSVVDAVETRAGRIVERARDVLREVEGVHQLRAERTRTIVRQTAHTTARRVVLNADEDVKIDGQKINLG